MINFNNFGKGLIWKTVAVAGVLAFMLAGQVSAKGKKGPRASVSAATVCDIVDSDFTVEIRVRDKTSGNAIPRVTAWSITALAKTERGPWANQPDFGSESQTGLRLPVPVEIGPIPFSLCVLNEFKEYVINPVIADAKGLNAMAEVTYGRADGDEVVDQRTIMNMCSDDPETLDIEEPSGIKLTPADIKAIKDACLDLNQ